MDIHIVLFIVMMSVVTPCAAEEQPTWASVLEKCQDAGIEIRQVLATLRICTDAQLPAETALKILKPVYSIKNAPVMHTLLLEKIEEGVSKRADADTIIAALEKRQQAVVNAQRITAYCLPKDKATELVSSVTYALESGISSPTVTVLLQYGNELSADKLKPAIESAEFLQLAGTDEKKIQELVRQLIDRKLNISEIKQLAARTPAADK